MVTRRTAITALPALVGTTSARAASPAQAGDALETFEIDELRARRESSGRPYLPFLDRPTLRCGLYVLPAGGEDRQSPHETDEVYYVLSGRSKIVVDGESRDVSTGSVIFVKAGAEHRFVDIEEDIELLVFFD